MENTRASALMVLAMAFFAVEDMFVKFLSYRLPVGEILGIAGVSGFAIFWVMLRRKGGRFLTPALWHPVVVIRTLGELIGTIGFVSAVALTEISSASAILQALPLAIVLGAALFLGETVGWRRWLAIGAGFVGVLMIVKPGLAGFEPRSFWAVLGVIGLAIRDLATRRVPARIPSDQLSTAAWGVFIIGGPLLGWGFRTPFLTPTLSEAGLFAAMMVVGVAGYATLVTATRIGDAAVIAPFRYSRLIFALIIGTTVFAERPDFWTLAGAAVIAGAGAFALWREARISRRGARA